MNQIMSAVAQWLEQKYCMDVYRFCQDCEKFETDACPNSKDCLDTPDKPYFERKK